MSTQTKTDATMAGIQKGMVAAFCLRDGTCPVGIVEELHDECFSVILFDYLTGTFTFSAGCLDIGYAELDTVVKGTYQLDGDGYRVYDTSRLGAIQTKWQTEHVAPTAHS